MNSTSSALAKLKASSSGGPLKQGEKKETPQERLKRIMSQQLNKQSMCQWICIFHCEGALKHLLLNINVPIDDDLTSFDTALLLLMFGMGESSLFQDLINFLPFMV